MSGDKTIAIHASLFLSDVEANRLEKYNSEEVNGLAIALSS